MGEQSTYVATQGRMAVNGRVALGDERKGAAPHRGGRGMSD